MAQMPDSIFFTTSYEAEDKVFRITGFPSDDEHLSVRQIRQLIMKSMVRDGSLPKENQKMILDYLYAQEVVHLIDRFILHFMEEEKLNAFIKGEEFDTSE